MLRVPAEYKVRWTLSAALPVIPLLSLVTCAQFDLTSDIAAKYLPLYHHQSVGTVSLEDKYEYQKNTLEQLQTVPVFIHENK